MGYVDGLLGRNERIVFVTRQHWLVLVAAAFIDLFLALAAVIIAALLANVELVFGLFAILAVLPFIHFIIRFLNWHNDQFIVTTRRVMEVHGVVNKRVSDSSLEKVNDVVLEQSVLGRFLNFGTVAIITGSDIGVNYFKHITQPVRFKVEMMNQIEDLNKLESFSSRAANVLAADPPTSGDIPELITELDQLRKQGIITEQEFQAKKADLLRRI
jgi:uncharacterized membrane protein YdbT with pleckstrin-like domain